MNALVQHHPKLIGMTLHLPEDGEVLTGTVLSICAYEGTFYFLMVVEGASGFQTWDADMVYQDRADASEIAEATEDEGEGEDEPEDEDEDY